MLLKLQCLNTTLQVIDFKLALMATDNELPVMLIEDHLSDIGAEDILDDTDRSACPRIPDLDVLLTRHEDLKTLL